MSVSTRFCFAIVSLIVLFGRVVPAATQPAHSGHAFDLAAGSGVSNWGPIPAPADSARFLYQAPNAPIWATVLDAPYHVVRAPLGLLFNGIGDAVVYLDESGAISFVKSVLSPQHLPHGVTVSVAAGGLPGLGAGLTFYRDELGGGDNRLRLSWKSTSEGDHKVVLGTRFRGNASTSFEFGAGYNTRANARFFGLGYDADVDNESFYRQTLSWVGVSSHTNLGFNFRAEPHVLFSTAHARKTSFTDDDGPPLAVGFAGDLPPGYGRRSDGISVGFGLVHDTTTDTGRPRGSAYKRVVATYFTSTNEDDISFWSYRGDLQEFIPLWYDDRALAFRGVYSRIDPIDGAVPFQRLLTNDEPDLYRGFRDFRWRDRGMAIATLEMRWPFWSYDGEGGVDTYIFGEAGQVFHDSDELSLNRMEPSFGGGFRLITSSGFAGRVEIGVSDEETVFRIRSDQVFQFPKGSLFHGRNPVPSR